MTKLLQPGQNYVSPVFNEDNSSNYRLSIGLSLDGFSFLVMDEKDVVVMINSVSFQANTEWNLLLPELKDYLSKFSWLKSEMKKKVAMIDTTRFTIMPFSLYDSRQKKTYLALNHPVNENDLIREDILKVHYAYLLYAVNQDLFDTVNALIPGLSWQHYANALVNSCNDSQADVLKVDIRYNRFYVLAFSKQKLKFCNAFRYRSKEDFVYFIVLVYKQLGLDPEAIHVQLSGLIRQDSEVVRLLQRYVKNVSFGDIELIGGNEDSDDTCFAFQYENFKRAVS
ncbi:MAG: DUF3822 family protein [Bacteroidota bacterium]